MAWSVEGTDEFRDWFVSLDDDEQQAVIRSVDLLEEFGPALTRPYADTIRGSAYPNMRELRSQVGGRPLRTLYAFDPRRVAILLIGGDKTGDKNWYDRAIPIADRLYQTYLDELEREGLI